jgi:hypothetical protein
VVWAVGPGRARLTVAAGDVSRTVDVVVTDVP